MKPLNKPPRALAAWQRRFKAAIKGQAAGADELDLLAGPGPSANERFGVYRDAYFARLRDSLMEDFPRLYEAVGPKAFASFARDYLSLYPSRSETLFDLGNQVLAYLGDRPELDENSRLFALALRDTAELRSFLAPDPDLEEVAALDDVATFGDAMRLAPHPSVRIVGVGGVTWLSWRGPDGLGEFELTSPQTRLLDAIGEARPLSQLGLDPRVSSWDENELQALIAGWIEEGILCALKPAV